MDLWHWLLWFEANKLPVTGMKGFIARTYLDYKTIAAGQDVSGENRGIWPFTAADNPYINDGPAFEKWQQTLKEHPQLETRDVTYDWALAAARNSDKIMKSRMVRLLYCPYARLSRWGRQFRK